MKGSGVACIVNQKWAKHHWETVVFSPYLLNIKFLFQNLQINVWTIYAAPSDLLILQNSFNIITEQYTQNLNTNQFHIITGDFNQIYDDRINHSPPPESHKNHHRHFELLINLNFFDTYKELYPEDAAFTWTNGTIATRIDQIWMSEEAEGLIEASFVSDSALITDSDHQIFTTILNTSELIPNNYSDSSKEH